MIDEHQLIRVAGALLARIHTIEAATGLRPTAIVLPGGLVRAEHPAWIVMPDASLFGLPVTWGQRPALVYDVEPPQ